MKTLLALSSKSTDFTTWLDSPIQTDLDKKYEAAFISLQTYNSIPNITEDNNKFKYSTDKRSTWKIVTLQKHAYEFSEINDVIQKDMEKNGDYDNENHTYYIDIDHFKFKAILSISNENYMVDFGVENSIGPTLGFTNERMLHGVYEALNIIDIEKVNSIQVHCDIVTGSYLNSRKSRVIHTFTQKVSPGYKVIERPSPELIFLPVVRRPEIESVRLWLTDQDNKPIDLMGERLSIVILIREKRH